MAKGKGRILVIDDDPAILELITQILTPQYTVKTTEDWLDGTDLLTTRRFELLILDLGMPVFDAPEFIKRVHTLSAHSEIPILIISAYPNLRERLGNLPVAGVLAKPFAIQDLLDKVELLLRKPSGE